MLLLALHWRFIRLEQPLIQNYLHQCERFWKVKTCSLSSWPWIFQTKFAAFSVQRQCLPFFSNTISGFEIAANPGTNRRYHEVIPKNHFMSRAHLGLGILLIVNVLSWSVWSVIAWARNFNFCWMNPHLFTLMRRLGSPRRRKTLLSFQNFSYALPKFFLWQ